jgi:biotin carboxylase
MPRVLLLAATTGYQTRAFGEAAERLGVDLVFATDRCSVLDDPWLDSALPIRFHDERAAVDAIVAAARKSPIDGVLAVGDRPTVIAARVSEALGLAGHPPDAAAAARNKWLTRERLRSAGLPVPWFLQCALDRQTSDLEPAVRFPAVVKPLALSGSRGVMRVNDAAELAAAFARIRGLLQAPDIRAERSDLHDRVLIEGFIPGREFALEGLMNHG